jgi:hypothetical protein
VPRVKYTMNYRPINSFSMSYVSRKVIFPGARKLNTAHLVFSDLGGWFVNEIFFLLNCGA